MALDSNYLPQQVFLEIVEREISDDIGQVCRREDVTNLLDRERDAYAASWVRRTDPATHKIRLARYTVEVLRSY